MQLDSSLYRPVLHAKTGNTVMALLVPLIQRCDPNPICLRWVVCLALDNNVNNTLTKKHEIISRLLSFHSLLVVYFLKTSQNKSRHFVSIK